jgi:undecaprenyl-diphosphatase
MPLKRDTVEVPSAPETLHPLGRFDAALLIQVRRWEMGWLTHLMKTLTQLGDPGNWIALALVLMAMGGDGPRYALRLAAAASLAVLASQILKRLARRPRPAVRLEGFEPLAEAPDAFSFPSGHSCAAFAVAVALLGEGLALGPALMALATGIAVSRVYLGAHYPLDVAAGTVLGVLCGGLTRWMLL